MRRPQPISEAQLADLQRRAAVLFMTTMIGRGSRPSTHASQQLIGGVESALTFNLVGWRIPTAKFDGTPQDSIRDCVIAPDGEIFPIDQYDAAGDGIARPAHLPVYGLLEGIIELYERNFGTFPLAYESPPPPTSMDARGQVLEPATAVATPPQTEDFWPNDPWQDAIDQDTQLIREFIKEMLRRGVQPQDWPLFWYDSHASLVAERSLLRERMDCAINGWVIDSWVEENGQVVGKCSSKVPKSKRVPRYLVITPDVKLFNTAEQRQIPRKSFFGGAFTPTPVALPYVPRDYGVGGGQPGLTLGEIIQRNLGL